jgi:hypothetical protein
VVTGTFILAFGWFGFNAGSTLAGTDTRITVVATNTMLASAAGALAACAYVWTRFGKPDVHDDVQWDARRDGRDHGILCLRERPFSGSDWRSDFLALDTLIGNRPAREDELSGLDVPEMGLEGYSTEPGVTAGRGSMGPDRRTAGRSLLVPY